MYQGRFEAKNRQGGQSAPKAERNVSVPELQEKKPAAEQRKPRPVQEDNIPKKKKKKGSTTGSIIFYTLYCLMIAVFFVAMFGVLDWLHTWLMDYEAAQPNAKCEAVFAELFEDPDWEQIYTLAGIEDGQFDGKAAYAAHMEAKVGDQKLSYMETAAGLSGDKKYYVKLGDEKLASFTLSREITGITEIPDWKLDDVSVMFKRTEDVKVQKLSGHTVYVNGIALDNTYTIKMTSTVAEEYLPNGVQGVRTDTQYVSGLLIEPAVTVKDENGNEMAVVYDEASDTYVEQIAGSEISEEERSVVIKAAENYCKFMIAAPNSLSQVFDKNSKIYGIMTSPDFALWMQDYTKYEFKDEEVTAYRKYSDTLFSAHITLTLPVTRTNGTIKEYTLDTTYFFQLQSGAWKVIEMTNVDITEEIAQVRLTFMEGENQLSSSFVDADSATIETPVVSAPEGKVFSGWYREDVDANGNRTLSLVFNPGTVDVTGTLEPMTLYALFEDAGAAAPEATGEGA